MVPTTTKKWLLGAFLALVGALSVWGAYYTGLNTGIKRGIDAYHEACYTMGGFIMDEQGRAVACKGLTQLPRQELPLDKGTTI